MCPVTKYHILKFVSMSNTDPNPLICSTGVN